MEDVHSQFERFEQLSLEQARVVSDITSTYGTLLKEIEDLREERDLLRDALKERSSQSKLYQREIETLKNALASKASPTADPITLILLDGDGSVFQPGFLREGQAGGERAAALLQSNVSAHYGSAGNVCAWVYMNQTGLRNYLDEEGLCDVDDFDEFVQGFNRSAELFSIVDCGSHKEAADSKVREMLKVFVAVPQVARIIFGGAHDTGYLATLQTLKTRGLGDKIVTLDFGYVHNKIKDLGFATLRITDLFMAGPVTPGHRLGLDYNPSRKTTAPTASKPSEAIFRALLSTDYPNSHDSDDRSTMSRSSDISSNDQKLLDSSREVRYRWDHQKAIFQQIPKMCTPHILDECLRRDCPYSHQYYLSDQERTEYRMIISGMKCLSKHCKRIRCPYKHQ